MSRASAWANAELDVGEEPAPLRSRQPETPFRILILGDFSGRASRGVCERQWHDRRALAVDRDNFDLVLEGMRLELALPAGAPQGPGFTLRFSELDDFHPDRIFERLGSLEQLREIRRRLADRSTFAATAAELGARTPKPAERPPAPRPESERLSAAELFDRMLEQADAQAPASRPSRAVDDWDRLLQEIVTPHLEPKADPQQPEWMAQVDAAISGQMRAILHHPDFQALEAGWRALLFLVRRLETGEQLRIYLLDVSRAELAADVDCKGLRRVLVDEAVGIPGTDPWAAVAAHYTFGESAEDLELAGRLAAVARDAGAPLIAAASPRLLGCDSLAACPDPEKWKPAAEAEQSWGDLRRLPQATWMGLALPRFLLRLPYGRETDATERFAFEEMRELPVHEQYLWGNPAFACAYLLGAAFSQSGWELRPGEIRDIEGLPAHVYRQNGEAQLQPCAETLLTEAAAEKILEAGLMPLVSFKGSDRVRLLRFQSIAEPASSLAGRWA